MSVLDYVACPELYRLSYVCSVTALRAVIDAAATLVWVSLGHASMNPLTAPRCDG